VFLLRERERERVVIEIRCITNILRNSITADIKKHNQTHTICIPQSSREQVDVSDTHEARTNTTCDGALFEDSHIWIAILYFPFSMWLGLLIYEVNVFKRKISQKLIIVEK
jgi:hypothetical protein